MADINTNKKTWETYNWAQEGDEWSVAWGKTKYQWYGSTFPRIMDFVPANRILEIAPGHGRCTQFLKELCKELIVVDLIPRCIEYCKARFADDTHIKYYKNDGKSLDMIEDGSIDFVFSWDSLVHADFEVVDSYIGQLNRILTNDGVAFIHHSNLGYFEDISLLKRTYFRDPGVTYEKVRESCEKAGLSCIRQELIGWGIEEVIDCFTVITKKKSKFDTEYRLKQTSDFMVEADCSLKISQHYDFELPEDQIKRRQKIKHKILKLELNKWCEEVKKYAINKELFIWGAGEKGKQILKSLQSYRIKVKGFVDKDQQKAGSMINNIPVYSIKDMESISEKADVFIIIGTQFIEEVTKQLVELGMREEINFGMNFPFIKSNPEEFNQIFNSF